MYTRREFVKRAATAPAAIALAACGGVERFVQPESTPAAKECLSLFPGGCIGATPLELQPKLYHVISNVVIARPVVVQPGAMLQPGPGVTITLTGPIEAGDYQWIDPSLGGEVKFGAGAVSTVPVQWYGARLDNRADDTVAIQAALNGCPPRGVVRLAGRARVSAMLVLPTDYTHLAGPGTLIATHTSMLRIFYGKGRTGCTVTDIDFDANRNGRVGPPQSTVWAGAEFNGSTECQFIRCTARNTAGFSSASAIGLALAGLSVRCRAEACKLVDCGESATVRTSDGIFTSGDYNVIINCTAERCTDTAYVLEKSNYSMISNSTAHDCAAIAAIVNARAAEIRGNVMIGVTGVANYNGGTGQAAIGCVTPGAGNIYDTTIADCSFRCLPGVAGFGPAINVQHRGGGRAVGVTIRNCQIDGSTTQGILVDGDDVHIEDTRVKPAANEQGIKFQTGTRGGTVSNTVVEGGSFGISSNGTAVVTVQNSTSRNARLYALYAGGTSTLNAYYNDLIGAGVGATGKDAGATLNLVHKR